MAPMVMRGRETRGFVRVAEAGVTEPGELDRWVAIGLAGAEAARTTDR